MSDDKLARRNVYVLATAQALAGGNAAVIFATAAISGAMLAPSKTLATIPVTAYVVGLWAGALPVGYLSRRFGRRTAFQIGTLCGVLIGLISALAMLQGSFALLTIGTFFGGLYAAAHQAYRFAAADTASEGFKPKAISWVMAGGLAGAFIGPQLAVHTKDLWPPYLFAATYIGQSVLALMSGIVLMALKIPKPVIATTAKEDTRPLSDIARQPRFIVAVVCGVASYSLMNLVMTSSPLAMVDCGHSINDATIALQWHVVGMYAPSFFTGPLIARFGVERITGLGLVLFVLSAVTAIAGTSFAHFLIALALLGVAWNFGFVGATAMVTDCYRPAERNKVQAFNDFLVFGSMMVGSVASGQVLVLFGWNAVNEVVLPVVVVALGMLIWLWMTRPRQHV